MREYLQKEFHTLRKGTGLKTWKLEQLSVLPEVIANRLGLAPGAISPEQMQAYLIHEIDHLNTVDATALRNALAIGKTTEESLSQRRHSLASKLKRHTDTIEAYENRAIKTIVRRLTLSPSSHQPPISPTDKLTAPSVQPAQLEKAFSDLITQGLGSLLNVDTHTTDLLRCFSPQQPPYLDTTIEMLLLPSSRGDKWYEQRLRYSFRRNKDCFRVAVTHSASDSNILLLSGAVDEAIQLDNTPDFPYEMAELLQGMRFAVKEKNGRQQLYLFSELSPQATASILEGFWQINTSSCRIVEVQVPPEKVHTDTVYEFWLTFQLRTEGFYAYWYSPALMFLNTIIVDISRFPNRDKLNMDFLPFFGHVFPSTVEAGGNRFTMPANSWIMQGHGLAINWQKKSLKGRVS